jgi:trimeric autotransporter adhesin
VEEGIMKWQSFFGQQWMNWILCIVLALEVTLGITGCGGGQAPPPPPPAPMIGSISPTSASAGGKAFTLTVNGSNFVSGATVQWNGNARTTTFVSSTQLTAAIAANDIATAGSAQVTVVNSTPNSINSNPNTFTINPVPGPPPAITSISPTSALAGGPGFTLTVNGSNFTPSSSVDWGPGTLPRTTFVSSSQLNAQITPDFLLTGYVTQVGVFETGPGGSLSNTLPFTVNYPLPVISSLTPSSIQAGAAPFLLDMTGTGLFAGSSIVQWNGSQRPVTSDSFLNQNFLEIKVSAADVASPGTAQIIVVNPTPGGGSSAPASLTIKTLTSNTVPAISSLSDVSAPAGWPGFSLTVNGSGFVAATTTEWNGLTRSTSVLSSSLLKTTIPASDLAIAAPAQVSLVNPPPGGGNSNSISFAVKSVPSGAVGVIERSSVATDLTEANAYSDAAVISADGRFIAFSSYASNLVSGDTNGTTDIFLRDTCRGVATSCTPSVIRVSIASDESEANGSSFSPAISANGRFIAFASDATNLVLGDTNGTLDVFVRDTCTGASNPCNPSTTRVSVDDSGGQLSLDNFAPSISNDGRYVAFASGFPGDDYYYGPNFEIYVRDTCTGTSSGCIQHTIQASVHAVSGPATVEEDGNLMLSASGRFVAFTSDATDLVSGDTNGFTDVFLRDTCIGGPAGCAPSTVRVSVASGGIQSNGSSSLSSLSADGRFVAFISNATNLAPGVASGRDIFVRDTCIGAPALPACTPSTTLVSVATTGGSGNDVSSGGSLSADGRFIAFDSYATNLVPGDTNNAPDIFLRDTCAGVTSGCTPSTIRISIAVDGTQSLGPNAGSAGAALSADGRFAAFLSGASNLGPGDTNGQTDVFLARTNVP